MKKTALTLLLLLAGFTLDAQAEPLTWDGSEGRMTWNTTDDNWLQDDAPVQYKNGSDVVFGDKGSGEVMLDGTLKPGSVLVEAGNDYIFSGTGKLSGSMQLTKNGSGTLTINTANEYSGGTVIKEGTIVMGNDKALGTGDVTLGAKLLSATLELGGNTLSADVTVPEDASVQIGNGTLNGNISLGYYGVLTLSGFLSGTGDVIMDKCSTLDLNGTALYRNVTLNWDASSGNGFAAIGKGTLNGKITVGDHRDLTVLGELSGTGAISLGDSSKVFLSGKTLSKDVNVNGNASFTFGTINGKVTVAAGKCLSLEGEINMTSELALGEGSTLDLGNQTMTLQGASSITFSGLSASIGNGTLNGSISVGEYKTLTLSGDLNGTGSITLEDNAMLALNENTLSHDVTLTGDAEIGTGTIKGTISVATGKKLTLLGKLDGEGSISLGDQSSLDLLFISVLTKDVSLTGDANIGSGTINSSITVGEEKTLTLIGNLDGTGSISLGDKATLDLNESTLSKNVTLTGDANIGNGKLDVSLSVDDGKSLTLIGDLSGDGSITLGDNASLSLNNHSISHSVIVDGNNASIGNGTIGGDLILKENVSFSCDAPSLQLAGSVILYEAATLDLNEHSISNNVILKGSNASIGKGTIGGDLILEENVSFSWDATALQLAGSVILHEAAALTLDNHSISNNVTVNGSNVAISGGTLNGNVTVAEGKSLFLQGNAAINGTMTLGNGTTLDMGGAQAKLSKFTFTGQSATIDNATLIVGGGEKVTLTTNLSGSANISLGNNATLDLSQHTLSNSVTLTGNAYIGNGTLNTSLSVGEWNSLTLIGDLSGSGIISLGDATSLNLNNHTLSKGVSLNGAASIGNGMLNGNISVGAYNSLFLSGRLDGTGSISLGDKATLHIGLITPIAPEPSRLNTNITLTGDAEILGCIDKSLMQLCALLRAITVEAGKTLSLKNYITVLSDITLGDKAALDLGGNTAWKTVTLSGDASIGNGVLAGTVSVNANNTLTLIGDLSGEGAISLGDKATLNLGKYTLSNSVSLAGDSAFIGNGKLNSDLSVKESKQLTLIGNLSGAGSISLGNDATLDLGEHTLANSVSLAERSAKIGNGKLNSDLSVGESQKLYLIGDLSGTGKITLGQYATLDLGGYTLSNKISLSDSPAFIGNGQLNGTLSVGAYNSLFLSGRLSGTGSIVMEESTTLVLNGNNPLSTNISAAGNAQIGSGMFNGNMTVAADKKLSLYGTLYGTGNIYLGDNATLDLCGNALSNSVSLAGNSAKIGNGLFNGTLSVGAMKTLTLFDNLDGEGTISLADTAMLDLNGHTLSGDVTLSGNASILGGTHNGNISLDSGATLHLTGNLDGEGSVNLGSNAKLDLGYIGILTKDVTLTGSNATIANGTVNGKLTAGHGGSAQISNATIKAGDTTVTTVAWAKRSLLQEISVSDGLIAGTDRQSSLADGLYIKSESDLLIESMTITADNEIHVGQNTITLKQVTIDLSTANYHLPDSVYYFQLQDLINCTLEMDDVVFDASELKLPTGFDPLVNGIGMDFGPDVTIDPQTAKNLTLLMGDSMSRTVSFIDGKPVFTALVPTPEPTTGTLSLLALAGLAARRRRK